MSQLKKNTLVNDSDIKVIANKFEWKYLRQSKVNLLVFRPDRPYFKQKQKNNIPKFWPAGFFLIYYFMLFEEKRNKT